MRLSFLLMMAFLVSVFHANCQSDDLSIKDAKSLADQLVLKKDYLSAAKHYEHAFNKKTSDLMSAYQAGKYFLLARDYLNAAKNLRHVSNSKLKGIYDARFLYAKALKSQENYVNAAIEFKKFASEYLQEDFEEVFKKTELELTGCEDAMNEKDGDVSYRKYTFKTDYNDISARRVNNKIYLTSGNKPIVSDYKFLEEKAFEESLFSHLNCKAFSGSMAFNESGDELFFTSCSDSTLTSDCIILQSILVDGQWSSPVPLAAYINAAATASKDPFVVNKDGADILYFSSNRSGGKGGFDIWYSVRNNGSQDFSIPTNAGMINTSGDELSPSYNKTASDLYFSSNGHPSSGGFDIFKVTGDKNTWAAFTHLTAPFNSGADDTYPFYDHDGNIMFSSNRSTTSKESTIHDDIYFYLVNNPTPKAQNDASSNVAPKLKDDEISLLPKRKKSLKKAH